MLKSFNPHTHEGCDRFQSFQLWNYSCFNPHTHEGCDTLLKIFALLRQSFNPHTHEGCDIKKVTHLSFTIQFQSTHPRRVWLLTCRSDSLSACFNPHTHEGCDNNLCCRCSLSLCFNPHTHEGCDSKMRREDINQELFQSTHPRRVWPDPWVITGAMKVFQSTHPRRVWHDMPSGWKMANKFQSTHPRRVWRWAVRGWVLTDSFNPHTHEGCDSLKVLYLLHSEVSIHTPTKGVTPYWKALPKAFVVSIHTPTKGVT